MDAGARLRFDQDCNGLRAAIERACDATRYNGPAYSLGNMDLHEQAEWLAKHVVRKARALGLYGDADVRQEQAA